MANPEELVHSENPVCRLTDLRQQNSGAVQKPTSAGPDMEALTRSMLARPSGREAALAQSVSCPLQGFTIVCLPDEGCFGCLQMAAMQVHDVMR